MGNRVHVVSEIILLDFQAWSGREYIPDDIALRTLTDLCMTLESQGIRRLYLSIHAAPFGGPSPSFAKHAVEALEGRRSLLVARRLWPTKPFRQENCRREGHTSGDQVVGVRKSARYETAEGKREEREMGNEMRISIECDYDI